MRRSQPIVVVKEGDKLSRGKGKRGVGVGGDAAVLCQVGDFHARVGGHRLPEQASNRWIATSTVGDAELPVVVELVTDRLKRVDEVCRGGIEYGNDDADLGSNGPVPLTGRHRAHRGVVGLVQGDPVLILVSRVE